MKIKKDFVDFPQKLKLDRKALRVNQAELAHLLGVQPSYISRLEHGDSNPSESLVRLLASHTGNSYTYYSIEAAKEKTDNLSVKEKSIQPETAGTTSIEEQVALTTIGNLIHTMLENYSGQDVSDILQTVSIMLGAVKATGSKEEKITFCKSQCNVIFQKIEVMILRSK